jgi:hypothetical protein
MGGEMIELLERINPDTLIGALTVIAIVVGIPGAIIYWDLRREKLHFEERRSFIEKGMTPTPEKTKTPEQTMAMWGMYTSKMQRQHLQFEERRLMIEKGMTPPSLLVGPAPGGDRWKGIVIASLGLGMSVGYFALTPANTFKELIGFAGPILAFLGIGLIVYSSQTKDASPAGPTPGPGIR